MVNNSADIKIQDKDWERINFRLQLPDDARILIERMLSYHALHTDGHDRYQTPRASFVELDHLQAKINELEQLLCTIGPRSRWALFDTAKNKTFSKKSDVFEQWQRYLQKFSKAVGEAGQQVKKVKTPPGTKAIAVDIFVEHVENLLQNFTGKNLDRGKASLGLIKDLLEIVDPAVSDGTIEASIKRRTEARKAIKEKLTKI